MSEFVFKLQGIESKMVAHIAVQMEYTDEQ